jgi:hypothetical protein
MWRDRILTDCSTCRWWQPYEDNTDDPETGVCSSVHDNDYARADLVDPNDRTIFLTYSSFSCADWTDKER